MPFARAFAPHPKTILHVIERTSPPGQANAGYARQLAMEQGALLAGDAGVLLMTDGDAEVDHDWLATNLAALRAGADAIAGWVDFDPTRIPLL